MEYPGLGVQASGRRVVRHPNVGSELAQGIEGPLLGAVGIGGGENPEGLAVPTMPAKDLQQRTDAAEADEGHHHVDRVS